MDNAEPFIPYMERLKGSARYFFEREFFDRSFSATKKQISKRLWGVLATPSFERMFAQPKNKVDMFELLNSGGVVLINTAKDLLKQDGCELFGRFFLSMISQAAMERSVVAEKDRTPTTVYIDEAHEYFDDNIGILLAQARKYKIGLVCGNQTLDQLSPGLRASFMSNTGIKIVGGLSSKDANAFSAEMHTNAEFLQSLKKRQTHSEFALYVRHHTNQAIRIEVPLGFLESQDTLDEDDFDEVVNRSRDRFSIHWEEEEISQSPFKRPIEGYEIAPRLKTKPQPKTGATLTPAPKIKDAPIEEQDAEEVIPNRPVKIMREVELPPAMGRGGRQHKYLQELIKGLAESNGYRARIEDEVLDGAGFVDVTLSRGSETIACEVSITTPPEKELENIKKCFASGYELVWVVSPDQKHLKAIHGLSELELTDSQCSSVVFMRPEDIPTAFSDRPSPPIESTVRGYRVRVKKAGASFDETQSKRATVAEILAKSLSAHKAKEASNE